MKILRPGPYTQFILSLGVISLVSLALFGYLALKNGQITYGYLPWNLFLAWVPFVVTIWLVHVLHRKLWSSYEAMLVSLLWLLFLPNSFYMISDYIHLQSSTSADILYDAILFTGFIFTALLLGLTSLYLFHRQVLKRFYPLFSSIVVAVVLLICSFAIFIGRDLRWNSWDAFVNPLTLLFDVSDWLLTPSAYPKMFEIVTIFFVLLSSIYAAAFYAIHAIQRLPRQD